LGPLAGLVVALCVVSSCSRGAASAVLADSLPDGDCGGAICDAGCQSGDAACLPPAQDLVPVPRIRFNLNLPTGPDDYPYTPDALPPAPATPRSTVYLSAADSFDPEGHPVTFFWNVRDLSGSYLPLDPDASAAQVSFSPEFLGAYIIALEVIEADGLHQLAQVAFTLTVAPRPCAPDGVAAPCSDMLAVPGGTFTAGSVDTVGFPNEHPAHPADVAPFLLDAYEVTVGRFRKFLASFSGDGYPDGTGAHPLIPGSGWQSVWSGQTSQDYMRSLSECGGPWTDTVGDSEARPVTCVTWYQAFAFCISEGKRLPTEAEWEFAAVGGSEQRTYPWGDALPTPALAVYGCKFDGMDGCSAADLPVVGSTPAGVGRWGHFDLAGSVWEWTLDVYDAAYSGAPCDNCANLAETPEDGRVFRGGAYIFEDMGIESDLRGASRLGFDAKFPDPTRGLRCAQSLP
jgi:formylglycine-generating enzyme required for sulfatase activity